MERNVAGFRSQSRPSLIYCRWLSAKVLQRFLFILQSCTIWRCTFYISLLKMQVLKTGQPSQHRPA